MNRLDRSGLTRRNVGNYGRDDDDVRDQKGVKAVLKALDANPKLKEDYTSHSTSGVITTLVCAALCVLLFFGEFFDYRSTKVVSELRVNPMGVHSVTPNAERLKIDIDITFHSLACNLITLDTADKAGEQHFDLHDGHIEKRRLNHDGKPIDAKVTLEKPNKHQEITQALEKLNETDASEESKGIAVQASTGTQRFARNFDTVLQEAFPEGIEAAFRNEAREGCEVKGYLEVNRVSGQFTITPGRMIMMGMQQFKLNVQTNLDLTHTIHRLSFGESFPGLVSPLDGTHRMLPPNAVQQYFLNVVSTTFQPLKKSAEKINTHQYSVTETFATSQRSLVGSSNTLSPGVVFKYEIAPIRVDFKETRKTLGSFIIGICSIIGGVVTMAGVVQGTIEYVVTNQKAWFTST